MKAGKIPHDQLSPEALHGVIEKFVTREGTDYGEKEVSIETRIAQVHQLQSGKAVIVFGEDSETCNIFSNNKPVMRDLE